MASRNDQCEKAIKFISNSIKNYTEPESLERWCESAKTEAGYDKSAHSFSRSIIRRLDKIEDLKGHSLMEKVRLIFIFSRPVSPEFLRILKEAKCTVELNDEKKMTYFRSPEGDCVLQSVQDPNTHKRKFKGKPILQKTGPTRFIRNDHCEKAIQFIWNGIKNYTEPENLVRWCDLAKTEVNYDKSADSFVSIITRRLDRIKDLKGFLLMEKVRLVFLFSRPVSSELLKILKDEQCIVKLNDSKRIAYFSSPDGSCVLQSDHNQFDKNFKGKPYYYRRRKTDIQVRIPDNVQIQPPPASPQNLPSPPEMDDVKKTNGGKEAAPEEEKQEKKAPERKEEENRSASTKQKSNLNTEEDVDVTTESIQQEAPFNGRIDYDDLDIGEYPEFMASSDDEFPNHHKERQSESSQVNPKRLKIDKPRESEVAHPPEINDVETRNVEGEAAPEVEQKPEVLSVLKPAVKESLNIHNQYSQARDVKIEDFLEEIQREPEEWIFDEKSEMPLPATISLLKLAEQIETFAFNIYLNENFQQKALRAVRLFKANDQKIPIQEFNLLFNGMLAGLKRERIENSNKNSMQLIRLFKQLQRTLIRPLGEVLMAEALGILDDEIQKFGDSEDEIPLKYVQIKIDGFMTLITSSWTNLNE
ncbi:hypothetical protein B9Z55_027798 [Caenorhabditis nigoni]|uniref:SPK domain-containing protein n=1 Tax=Caenorhabditis nigoni TaxID=1611254 RepID=A0A2G5SEX7_9PELO|nr:hypothetical protein B9Z55_027798 [Caenorhabditis nigoni]